ncbi:hypothetical protein E7811_17615 [Aliigemmobacter aestuarii]|uniref:Class I SAM-dependent methyltransferase n=2 Tax=Aliigemmobacter aestuarii TaxID=1445661 RepID=A0A4S3MJY3_9RHOB|nr:hypothetical protein E7811_17615 [Gemmobacter aestuarii]
MPAPHVQITRSEAAARLAHDLSHTHCRGCGAYHAVWPYLRLIDPPRGVDADRDRLMRVLSPLLDAGTTVLLAGSADAGLAECVLDAAAERPVDLTVLDLCETPLRQCLALLGGRAAGRLRTQQGSITGAPVTPPVELIVAHSVLSFLPAEDLPRAGAFMGQSLQTGGRLVMTTSIGRSAPALSTAHHRQHVLSQLSARGVPLPGGEAEFAELLDAYTAGRAERRGPFDDLDALQRWLADAGLAVETIEDLRRGTGFDAAGRPVPRASKGVLVVARKGGCG